MKTLIIAIALLLGINQAQACKDFSGNYKSTQGDLFRVTQSQCEYLTIEFQDNAGKTQSAVFLPKSLEEMNRDYEKNFKVLNDNYFGINYVKDKTTYFFLFAKNEKGDLIVKSYSSTNYALLVEYDRNILTKI